LSKPRVPEPVKLFASLLAGKAVQLADTIRELAIRYGPPDYVSEVLPFDYTNYYAAEMGQSLVRRFITFDRLIRPDELPAVKLQTNDLEERLTEGGARRVNIDPGYVAKQHFILATGKGFAHRPYIGLGIYADLTLFYRKETYRPLEWTYPDYRAEQTIAMLNGLRRRYMIQLKQDTGERQKDKG
jgi:hypothetical protein